MPRSDVGLVQSTRGSWCCRQLWCFLLLLADLGCGKTEQSASEGGREGGDSGGADAIVSGGTRSAGGSDSAGRGGTGGSQSGASTTGGTESGGEAGSAGEGSPPDLPLPARCHAVAGQVNAFSCSLDVICDGMARTVPCHSTAAGWQCTCDTSSTDPLYLIDGAEGLNACAVGAGLCAGAQEDPDPADADCAESSSNDASTGALLLDLSCQTPVPVDFAPDVAAVRVRERHAACSRVFEKASLQPQEPFDCQCWNRDGANPYTVLADDQTLACRELALHCPDQAPPPFDGPEVCVRDAGESQDGSCSTSELCFATSPLSKGVTLAQTRVRQLSSCFEDIEMIHGLQCVCEKDQWDVEENSSFFYAPANGQTTGTCDLAMCDPETARERTGMVTCEPATVDTREIDSVVSCSSFTLCSQPAVIGGHDLLLQEYLLADCTQASDQSWWCSCALAEDTDRFELGEAVDGNDACTREISRCAERMMLPISPHGIPLEPPDPLPMP